MAPSLSIVRFIRNLLLAMIAMAPAMMAPALRSLADGAIQRNSIRSSVELLLLQLDAATLSERTRAERSLLDLGPDVMPYLPPPESTLSTSVREAVKRIRIQLERRAARESVRASLVQFAGESTIQQLLQELQSQTRNRIALGDDARELASQSLHVSFENQPFWECVDQIGDRLKLEPVFDAGRSLLTLQPRSPRQQATLMVQHTGPVRIALQSVEVRPIAGDPTNRLVRILSRLSLEPRLRPLFLHFAARDVLAINAEGRKLDAWNAAATYELPVSDAGRDVLLQLDFLLPDVDETRAITLKGQIAVQLAAGTERIVFDQTAQSPGTVRRRGGVSVQLREVKFDHQEERVTNATIGVTVSYDTGGPAFESHRSWMFHNAVYMETESGRRTAFTNYDTSLQSNGLIGVDYRWERLPEPATQYHFVYEAPTLIVDLPVELKLEKIAIPRS